MDGDDFRSEEDNNPFSSPSHPFNDPRNFFSDDDDDVPDDNNQVHLEEDNNAEQEAADGNADLRSSPVPRRVRRQIDEDGEDEDGEELFGDNMEEDYKAIPELDHYDSQYLDERDYSELSLADRINAETEMKVREKAEGRVRGKRRKGLDLFDASSELDDVRATALKKRRQLAERAARKQVILNFQNKFFSLH